MTTLSGEEKPALTGILSLHMYIRAIIHQLHLLLSPLLR